MRPGLRRRRLRPGAGLARCGGTAAIGSGELCLAFSTVGAQHTDEGLRLWPGVIDAATSPLHQAAAEAVEEAVLNALLAAETMTGAGDQTVHAIPHDRLFEICARYGRTKGAPR